MAETSASTSRPTAAQPVLSCAARLLPVGFGTGLLAGAVVGGLLSYEAGDTNQWWLTGATFGAMLGAVLGALVQVLNLAVLAVGTRTAGRMTWWWVVPLPMVASVLAVLAAASRFSDADDRAVPATIASMVIVGVAVALLAKWCTAPLGRA
ncbi:hypothetical protein [Kribbella deserti]|uniref:Uncharacterized protein n=1 Tax=Kribbella deserti TaxID=1926257 RepID=A0ABV6QPB1_9ACTN